MIVTYEMGASSKFGKVIHNGVHKEIGKMFVRINNKWGYIEVKKLFGE